MRNKRLDVLRFVAVLLVVTAHAQIWSFTTRVGWVGVDLFFVISGFLISGLLYSEYKAVQSISFGRFFVRRGLKIYPAFYVLILATFVAQHVLWHGTPMPVDRFLNEVAFIQNYRFGVWTHTWSLAVEEHFYIGLALLLVILARFSSDRSNPFRSIPWIFAGVAMTCVALRAITIWRIRPAEYLTPYVMNPTHARMDGLFFGVFLGYLYHFHGKSVQLALRPVRNRLIVASLTALLLSTCYVFDRDDHVLLSFGLSFLYLGFGGLLVLALEVHNILDERMAKIAEKIGVGCAFVGKHSYSIYLWHVPLLVAFPVFERKVLHVQLRSTLLVVVYVAGSFVLGIVFANLIEIPVLEVRDRLLPRIQAPVVNLTPRRHEAPLPTFKSFD